ncbi:hypothetical protein RFI_06782 [Reticulomyxa filosa]|uniref:Protein CLP1 homolog n=1 Tax=Reticulomyxa filosa TaxID=46433 RepID=X6NVK2_RETFI|nr:hypothetical protein RFI_06782 [Reticulomyxa filosa]|eukprot:ETO30340.1 hypothetical protein RFI_06782 [Reticulomyxa filosa]
MTDTNNVSMAMKASTVELVHNQELRIGVSSNQVVRIWLIKGTAEIFGVELKQSKPDMSKRKMKQNSKHKGKEGSGEGGGGGGGGTNGTGNEKSGEKEVINVGEEMNLKSAYEFKNCHISIYTCNEEGCKVVISGETQYSYVSNETPMMTYINYNYSLTNMRRCAQMALIDKEMDSNRDSKEHMMIDDDDDDDDDDYVIGGVGGNINSNNSNSNSNNSNNSSIINASSSISITTTTATTTTTTTTTTSIGSDSSNVPSHSAIDAIIEKEANTFGPRVMIVGPANTGKATLARILANYGVRSGFCPILVDLDCSLNLMTIPGAIAAMGMTESTNFEVGLHLNSNTLMSKDIIGGSMIYSNQCKPIVYYYGHLDPSSKSEVYRICVSSLALAVKERLIQCNAYRCGGVIIKCHNSLCSSPSVLGEVIDVFKVNVIIVVDDEYLYNHLKTAHKDRHIAVEKVTKSGGVKQKDETERQALRQRIIRNYFYGCLNDFEPSSISFDAKWARIYQIGKDKTESSLLPMDEKSAVQKFSFLPVRMDASLRGQVLAVLHEDLDQKKSETDTVEMSCVMGFVHVTDVSASQTLYGVGLASQSQVPFEITLLSPTLDSELYKKCFLKGNVVWTDR